MITDKQIAYSYREMYEQGVEKKEVRSYEVSIWTLQDEFITVLKWSDVEQKGRIQDPQLTIADDGTQEFKFSIPMYLYDGEKLVENPIWYNTRNGNIAINLRKIKVIFNKQSIDEKIFEFLITKVTETHEGDKLTCNIECEGLAFHELGKIGYTISLSLDDYDLVYKKWLEEDGTEQNRPKQNVQFWCGLIGLEPFPSDSNLIKSSQWYYEIDMNWDSVGGIKRNKNIVYEEPFVSEWNDDLSPSKVEQLYEKERTIDVHESNIYNITQEIAKQFGIFCRYEYGHDKNNHIIYKKVVFFNNCLHGNDGNELIIGFTYPHSSKKITREVDSKDIVTKMYVRSMEDPSVLLGEANITYCSANKTGDDYILNFDYLKETGSLTNEQIEAIEEYELAIHEINNAIIPLQNKIAEYERQKVDLEAKITTYRNSITLDKEQINQNSDLAQTLSAKYGDGSQYIDVFNDTHPDQGFIVQDASGAYYINLKTKQKGIKTDSIKIYRNYSSSTQKFSTEITGFKIEYDDYGNPVSIYGIAPEQNGSNKVYMTYEYEPHLYYDNVLKVWEIKLGADQEKYKKALLTLGPESTTDLEYDLASVYSQYAQGYYHTSYNNASENEKNSARAQAYENGLNYMIASAKETLEEKISEKQQIVKKFNNLMGPALREGYWQPEKYETYGRHYNESQNLGFQLTNALSNDTKDTFVVGWDDILFNEEIDIKYESGIDQSIVYYPCINLSSIYATIQPRLFEYSFIFNNNYYNDQADLNKISNIRNFSINANRGGEAVFSFIRINNNIVPALVLIGAKNMTTEQINFMLTSGNPRLGIINTTVNNGNVTTTIEANPNPISLSNITYWTFYPVNSSTLSNDFIQSTMSQCSMVYPRIKFSSLMLKTDPTNLFIRFANQPLEQFENYYVRTRSIEQRNYQPEYLITIKPECFAISNSQTSNNIMVDYVLSNASTSIYLDALKIEKENAYPKVSYTIDPNILNKAMIRTLYNKLSWIVHINDAQLKLKEAYGYISKLELNLDFPDKDTIEVKNYTTKFEDLFSTIVAQTENMQRNEGLLNRIARGQYALSGAGLSNTLNSTEMNTYFDKYFSESNTVQETLYNLFQEAGAILGDSTNALNQIQSLSQENSTILNGFAKRVQNELVPSVFRQSEQPDEFKKGDIWIEVDSTGKTKNTYLAVSDSDNARNGHGWMKTYDGSLSQIEGAVLNVDAQAGKIDITAQDVNIVGNQSVNIGGTIINIGSNTINGTAQQGAVNIYATSYDHITENGISSSRVLIDPERIEMAGAKITMLVGTQRNAASAIDIDGRVGTNMPDYGIWLGSSKGIKLYTGNGTSNANVEINPNHIIFGLDNMSNNNATAVEMTTSQILLAAGSGLTTVRNSGITINNGVAGVQITSNKIGLAVGANENRSAIIMDSTGLIIGTAGIKNGQVATPEVMGSYVKISGSGIDIGSTGYLKINTNDMVLNSQAGGSDVVLQLKNGNTSYLTYTADGKLNITVNNLTIGTNTYNSSTGITMSDSEIWLGVQRATQATSTGITLTNESLLLDVDTDNYIHMTTSGLALKGKNIQINDKPIWSHENIIILSNNQDQTTIEQNRSTQHDWVLIKPYYNAHWSYSGNSIGDTQLMDNTTVTLFTTTYTDQDLFGDGAGEGGYTYTFRIYAKSNMQDDSEVEANIRLALVSQDGDTIREAAITETGNFKLKSWAWHEFSLTCGINVLFGTGTGRTITCTVKDVGGRCLVRQASVIATCNVAASNRVPCTVYYYP